MPKELELSIIKATSFNVSYLGRVAVEHYSDGSVYLKVTGHLGTAVAGVGLIPREVVTLKEALNV